MVGCRHQGRHLISDSMLERRARRSARLSREEDSHQNRKLLHGTVPVLIGDGSTLAAAERLECPPHHGKPVSLIES